MQQKKVTSSGAQLDDDWIKKLSLVQESNDYPTELVWLLSPKGEVVHEKSV